jgi:hypothetical protein
MVGGAVSSTEATADELASAAFDFDCCRDCPVGAPGSARVSPIDGVLAVARRVSRAWGAANMLNKVKKIRITTPKGTSLPESVNQGFSGSSATGANS